MTLTSREIVWKAIRFEGPPRVPRLLPEPWGADIVSPAIGRAPGWEPSVEGEDEWGCVWRQTEVKNMGQVAVHPLDDWRKLDDYLWPDFTIPERYTEPVAQIDRDEGKFVVGVLSGYGFLSRMDMLRGTENFLCDHYLHPDELGHLADRVVELRLQAIRGWAQTGKVDAVWIFDDWGVQDRLLIRPELWRQFYKPRYARMIAEAHRYGLAFIVHSCGKIDDVLDDCIEIGLDVIQQDQQENMGLENLSRRFGGRICFFNPVDIQSVMQRGTPQQVAAYARRMVKLLGDFNGGFIAKWYNDPEGAGHSQENIEAMCRAFVEYGVYPLADLPEDRR